MDNAMTFDEMLELLKDFYVNQMPFNRLLGISIDKLTDNEYRGQN